MNIRQKPIAAVARFLALLVLGALFLPGPASAQEDGIATVIGAGQNIVNIVLADPAGSSSAVPTLQKYVNSNLSLLPFVKLIPPSGIPGGASVSGGASNDIDFKRFLMAGANILITTKWVADSQVEMRTFEVAQGRFLFGNRYAVQGGSEGVYDVADKFCGDLLQELIGSGTFFRSTMAFSKGAGKNRDIWAVKPNGRNLRRLTNIPGLALSPTWSPDGRHVLFSHIDYRSHALGVWDSMTNNTRRIRFPGNTVIGPSYMPGGNIAVGLSDGQHPSIFLLDSQFQKVSKIEGSYGIDISPSIDASGSRMAFTSNRHGGPQIFLKDLRSGQVSRVSASGTYNTDPSISPDGTMVAFARRTGSGHRIFVHDLMNGQEWQVSFGPGSDEEPAFAPDNFFIAYMSTRGGGKGIYLTTRRGGGPTPLPTGPGDASFPTWGAAR